MNGHRQRLRDRFQDFGQDSLKDHELLELLLFFSIPRRNTNPIAHALLHRFGSLSGVLAASEIDLRSVDGVGENTALLIRLVNEIARRARMTTIAKKPLNNLSDLCAYCSELLLGERSEQFCAILLDARFNLIRSVRLAAGIPDSVTVYPRLIAEHALKSGAARVVMVHNHPAGNCTPSPEDLRTTESVAAALSSLGVDLVEHIIVSDDEAYAIKAKAEVSDRCQKAVDSILSRGSFNPAKVAEYLRSLDDDQLDQLIALLESQEQE
ncbi:MAG: JAB domain-containing protein [Christensenellales bacterium]|jgi:DNA repair protein RadC